MKSGGIDRVIRGLDNNNLAAVSYQPSRRDRFAGVLKEAVRERAREGTDRVRYAAVERAVQFMRDRYWEQHSSRRLAEVAMMSRFHFHRTFTAYTGTSPGRYLAALRMQAAKRLLVRSNLRVADICFEVGYGSVGTFTSTFARLVGVPPLRFRQLASMCVGISADSLCPNDERYMGSTVTGQLVEADPRSGWAVLAMFPTRMPQGRPLTCALARTPGPFVIGHPPMRRLHLLVVSFPSDQLLSDLLLPESPTLHFGQTVVSGGAKGSVERDIVLQKLGINPPVVLALPLLLIESHRPRTALAEWVRNEFTSRGPEYEGDLVEEDFQLSEAD